MPELPRFESKDEKYQYTDVMHRAHVMIPRRSAASIAIISDNKHLRPQYPHPSITVMGDMTDETGKEVPPDNGPHSSISLVFDDPDEVLHLISHGLSLFLNEENIKLALTAISALANQEQTPIFVEAANAAMEQLEEEEK